MRIAKRVLTVSGAYLIKRAVSMAEKLFRSSSRVGRTYAILDGYLLSGSRAGSVGAATVMDFPIFLLMPTARFEPLSGGVPDTPHRDNSAPLLPSVDGYSFTYFTYAAGCRVAETRDPFVTGGLPPAEPVTSTAGQPGFMQLVGLSGGYETEELAVMLCAGAASWPTGGQSLLVDDTFHRYVDPSIAASTFLPGNRTQWCPDMRGNLSDPEDYTDPIEVVHRFVLNSIPPPLDTYPDGGRLRGLLVREGDYAGLGVSFVSFPEKPDGSTAYSLPTGYYPFEAQPMPWVTACPVDTESGAQAFIYVAHCILEREHNLTDGNGKRGLVVARVSGAYDAESGSSYSWQASTVVPPTTGEQSPQFNDSVVTAVDSPAPWSYFWLMNGYQPSVMAPFGTERVLAIHRHYVGKADVTGNTAYLPVVDSEPEGYDYSTARLSVHVFAQLVGLDGTVSEVDLLGPGFRYTPNHDGDASVFYDGLVGAAFDGNGTGVAVAIGFTPGWLTPPIHHPQVGHTQGMGFSPDDDPPDEWGWDYWLNGFIATDPINAGEYFYSFIDGFRHERSASDPRAIGIAVLTVEDGTLSAQTLTLPTGLYPLAEATVMAYPYGLYAIYHTASDPPDPPGVTQAHYNTSEDSIPSTTQGVAYIGNGKYAFLAATDVAGYARVAVVYDVNAGTVETRGEVFDASTHPVRTAAGSLQCLTREQGVPGEDGFRPAILVSTHADSGVGRWPVLDGKWKDAINAQEDRRGAGEFGMTFISYDSGHTWEELAAVGGYPGIALVTGLGRRL